MRPTAGRPTAPDRFTVENPATGQTITVVQGGGVPEIDAAVQAAHRAFQDDWRWRSPAERTELLLRGADVLEAHADELAELVSLENGNPVADARLHDVGFLVGIFRFFGSLVDKLPSEFYDKGSIYTSTVLEPLGVVGEIIPFNWPPIHADGKIAPALAVGDTVVLKPSEAAPLTVIRIVELLNTVLPPDVLHVVPGMGRVAGQALGALAGAASPTSSARPADPVYHRARGAACHAPPVRSKLHCQNGRWRPRSPEDRATGDVHEARRQSSPPRRTAAPDGRS